MKQIVTPRMGGPLLPGRAAHSNQAGLKAPLGDLVFEAFLRALHVLIPQV